MDLNVPSGLKETGRLYAYFVCLPKGKLVLNQKADGIFEEKDQIVKDFQKTPPNTS